MRIRKIIDPKTKKIWSTRCEGSVVLVTSGIEGKEKITEKPQMDANAAIAWAEKEEWVRLKKGLVFNNPLAKLGEPRMHYYRGRGYTGALPAFGVDGKIFCSIYDDTESRDTVFLLNENSELTALPELPKNCLIWKGFYQAKLKKILLLADHQILSLAIGDNNFLALTRPNQKPVSCLHISGTRAVWYEEPDLVVADITNNQTLLRLPMQYQWYSGHSPQMTATLSPDGNTLACCVHSGEIVLIDIATGKIFDKLIEKFEMIIKMAFTTDSRYLIASEQYGEWKLLCFDLNNMSFRTDWLNIKNIGATEFTISEDGLRIAIAHRSNIEIYDLTSLKKELSFRVEHQVKRFTMAWINKWLGVQTDNGCASLYVV
jgi:WD40 repeat protein